VGGLASTQLDDTGREQPFPEIISAVAAGDGTPVLLTLDDMHRADDAAADLLHQFIRSTRHRPVSIFIGARPGELVGNAAMQATLRSLRHDGLIDEMHLGPLAEADAAKLVASIAPGTDVGRIVELSGGNPLFAIELARHPHDDAGRLPLSLWYLLHERLDALTDASVELLRWAAVLGRNVRATQLQEIAGLGTIEFLQALDLIEQHDILRPSDENTYRFTHDLLRRAVLSTISSPRRTLMHLRIAEAADVREKRGAKAAL
jgi:predicted ATPase